LGLKFGFRRPFDGKKDDLLNAFAVTIQVPIFQEAKKMYSGQKSLVFAKYLPEKAIF